MKKLLAAAAFSLPLLIAGIAAAGEPMRLTDAQMDNVSAGASAAAFAAAAGVGNVVLTQAQTLADVRVINTLVSEQTRINLHLSTAASAAAVSAN